MSSILRTQPSVIRVPSRYASARMRQVRSALSCTTMTQCGNACAAAASRRATPCLPSCRPCRHRYGAFSPGVTRPSATAIHSLDHGEQDWTSYRVCCRGSAGEQVFDLYHDAVTNQWVLDVAHD